MKIRIKTRRRRETGMETRMKTRMKTRIKPEWKPGWKPGRKLGWKLTCMVLSPPVLSLVHCNLLERHCSDPESSNIYFKKFIPLQSMNKKYPKGNIYTVRTYAKKILSWDYIPFRIFLNTNTPPLIIISTFLNSTFHIAIFFFKYTLGKCFFCENICWELEI